MWRGLQSPSRVSAIPLSRPDPWLSVTLISAGKLTLIILQYRVRDANTTITVAKHFASLLRPTINVARHFASLLRPVMNVAKHFGIVNATHHKCRQTFCLVSAFHYKYRQTFCFVSAFHNVVCLFHTIKLSYLFRSPRFALHLNPTFSKWKVNTYSFIGDFIKST